MQGERRQFVRVFVNAGADVRSRRIWQIRNLLNLSCGGIFLVTDKLDCPGSEIEITFELGPEQKKIMAQAKVVWVRKQAGYCAEADKVLPAGMGIEFVKVYPQDGRKFLEDMIKDWKE